MSRILATFNGHSGRGAASVAQAQAGDSVMGVICEGMNVTGAFAPFVAVNGELFQTDSSDLSGSTFVALLSRDTMV